MFKKILLGISVLPVLAIIPAVADVSITEDINLNDDFPTGAISELVRSESGHVGTLTTRDITITGTRVDEENLSDPTRYLVRVSGAGSVLNLGTAENPVDSLTIGATGADTRAFTVWDDGVGNIYARNVNLSGDAQGLVAWGTYDEYGGTANVVGDNINVSAAHAIIGADDATVNITGGNVNVNALYNGIKASGRGTVNINADSLVVSSSEYDGIAAWSNDTASGAHIAGSGGIINVDTGNLTVNAAATGIGATYGNSQITINADGDVNVVATGTDDTRAISVGNSGTLTNVEKENTSFISITANNINLIADKIGVSAMSNGWVDLDGNVTISARDAILARGYATVNINESGLNTVKMDGDVNFSYYSENSGSLIDAYVNVTLAGEQSYWNGNSVVEYFYQVRPDDSLLNVDSFNLTLLNGAVWNATKITDTASTFVNEENGLTYSEARYYTALNNLTIDNGTVNIADMDRGIIVENANFADATFNGGVLNVGTLALTGGVNTFNNDVFGIDDTSSLTIASGASMNIDANLLNIDSITLDGNMLATLRSGDDAQITATTFDGGGTLTLAIRGADTYHVFGGSVFDTENISVESSVYDWNWDNEGKDLIATLKSVENIAEENGLTQETAAAVANLASSESSQLNDLAIVIQDKLASGDESAKQQVEQVRAAIHPETESVVQSVNVSMQNAVANLVAGRMSFGRVIGRSGGAMPARNGVWVEGLYNKSKHNDAFNGYTRGIVAGIDTQITRGLMLGIGYSYAHSDVSATVRNTEIDSNTIFAYGQYKPAAWYVNAMLNYTMSDYTEKSDVLDVSSDFDVDAFGAQVMTGYDFANGITPEIGLRYMHISADEYENSLGIKSKLDDADYLTGVLGAKYAFDYRVSRGFTLRPELRGAVKYDMLSDKQVAMITMPGVNSYVLNGNRLSRMGAEFGAGLVMKYQDFSLALNYDIEVREDYTSQTGRVRARYVF